MRGYLAPGTRIIESEVAERLGISRTPVRSALHQLQKDGYVLSVTGRKNTRLTVSPLTREDAFELYSIVAEMEALAVRWAAQLQAVPRERLVREMKRINEDLMRLGGAEDLDTDAIFEVHTEFHWCFVRALNAPRLQALHRSIKPQAERYRRIYSSASPENIRASCAEHEVIIASIQKGASAAAEDAVRENWSNSAERLSRLIATAGERGSW